jgi:uncharacterized protein YaeQ
MRHRAPREILAAMALSPTRLEYRLTLSNLDRGAEAQTGLIVARHPSESAEHVTLRVLAWCLLHEERLELGPGLGEPDAADLWTRDLTGRLTTWVECGTADPEKIRKVLLHHGGAAVHAVLADPRRRDELLEGLASWKKPPRGAELTVWTLPAALVAALAAREERRHSWTVTIVGGHVYLDADGVALDGAAQVLRPLEP